MNYYKALALADLGTDGTSVPGEHVLGRQNKRRGSSLPFISPSSEAGGPESVSWALRPWGRPDRMFLSSNAVTAVAWGSACGLRASRASPTPTSATHATTSCFPAVRVKTPSLCPRSAGLQSLRLYHGEVGAAPQARRGGQWVMGESCWDFSTRLVPSGLQWGPRSPSQGLPWTEFFCGFP